MKILAKETVRQYELTFLLPHSFTSAETQKAEKTLKDLLKKHGLTVTAESDWGKRELAYTIFHSGAPHTKAAYKHWVISGSPKNLPQFDKELRLNPYILRSLLVLQSDEASQFEDANSKA